MDTTIVVALITGGFSFLGCLIGVIVTNNKTMYRIEQLERKMEKHNNLMERTFKLEEKVEIIEKWVYDTTSKTH